MDKLNLKFKILNTTNDNEGVVYAQICQKRQKCELSTKIRGHLDDWNPLDQRFLENKQYNMHLNLKLDSFRELMEDIYRGIVSNGIAQPTVKMIKSIFRGEKDLRIKPKLVDFMEDYIQIREKMHSEYQPETISHYQLTLIRLKAYLITVGEENISLVDFKRKHVSEFRDFLMTIPLPGQKKALTSVSASKYLSKLRAVCNDAITKELLQSSPFNGIKLDRKSNPRAYLTNQEILQLTNLDLGSNKSLEVVRSIFLFSCYTGLRFSDAQNLKHGDIIHTVDGNQRITFTQKKTGRYFDRPALDKAVELIETWKLKNTESEYVLPRFSNAKLNVFLKTIANLMGTNKNLSHHVARHTFGSMMLENQTGLKMVSHMLGHASVKTTAEIYAHVSTKYEKDTIDRLNGVLRSPLKKVS